MDREAWRAAIHGVAKSQTRLSDWTELICLVNLIFPNISHFSKLAPRKNTRKLSRLKWKWKSLSRVRLFDPMDCNLPGFSVHEIFQVRILEWIAMPSSRESSRPREGTHISHNVGKFLYHLSHQGSPVWVKEGIKLLWQTAFNWFLEALNGFCCIYCC